jgi:uncharacterized cupin superfamily protein
MTAIKIDTSPSQPLPRTSGEHRVPVSALVARSGQVDYKPAPINPEWVIAGDPQARSGDLIASPDGFGSTNFWDCTAGKFNWHYGWDETVLILGGEVRVTDSNGATSVLRAGDVAHFPAGSSFTWEVERYVRKIAFHRKPAPTFRSFIGRYRRRITVAASVLGIALVRVALRRAGTFLITASGAAMPILEALQTA